MIFEQDKYYKYIGTLEKIKTAFYIFYILIGIVIGSATGNGFTIILFGLIGFFFASIQTILIKIRIQEMKWKMDVYNKIIK